MTATASHLPAERVKGYSSPVKTGTCCTGKSMQGVWSLIVWNLLVMGLCRAHNTNSYLCFFIKICACHMEWPEVRLAVSTLSPLYQKGLQPKHVQLACVELRNTKIKSEGIKKAGEVWWQLSQIQNFPLKSLGKTGKYCSTSTERREASHSP